MQIPRRVRIAFREELVGWYLRAIDDLFQAEGFRPGPDNPAVSGERRSRVEQYYSAVDWNSPDETSRVLRVFEEVLAGTENSEGRQNLIAVLQRDGFEVDDSGRIRRPGSETLAGLIERSDLPTGVRVQIDRMEKSLESDPEATIGAAKELIEATTKYVLDLLEVDYGSSPKVPELIRLAQTEYCGCRRYPEIEALGAEHDHIQELADSLMRSGDDDRAAWIETLRAAIEPHVAREESGVFEEARARGIAHSYWVEDLENDHRRFARLLENPSRLSREQIEGLLDDLHRHISIEEYDLFPAIALEREKAEADRIPAAS